MFLDYINCMRAIAIFLIVAGHSVDAFDWPATSSLEQLLRSIFCNGTVVFVFIAGYLFQHLSKRYDTKKYWTSKVRNVILPYLICSIPALLVFLFVREREYVWEGFYDSPKWKQLVMFYVTGLHLAPFWFVPMIVLYYLMAPVLIRGDRSQKIYWLIVPAICVSSWVIRGRVPESSVHFFSVYLLGMYFSRHRETVNAILQRRLTLIAVLMAYVGFVIAEVSLSSTTMPTVNYFQKLLLCCLLLGLLVRHESKLKSKMIDNIAACSFGVFFIHAYLITACKLAYQHWYDQRLPGSVGLFLIFSVLILLVSNTAINVLRSRMGKNSRLLVGS